MNVDNRLAPKVTSMHRSECRVLYFVFAFFVGVVLSGNPNARAAQNGASSIDPIESLVQWLKRDAPNRGEFEKQNFATAALTKSQANQIAELLWDDCVTRMKKERAPEWKDKVIEIGDLKMKFEYKIFGDKPDTGRSLFISMHGGGGAPAEVNEQQWKNQIGLYEPQEGVYLAPRAPTDAWNLWHQSHIDKFFQRIIQDAMLLEDVNPNRVYIMGYSAGGDGVYQLAPRMADYLAAAAMMAGHPNDASPLGLRNIGFTLHMGGKDGAYNRNNVARQWKEKLAELKKNDPGGYEHEVVIHEDMGHWMQREDAVAVPWMAKFNRNPRPDKIVWHQSGVTHDNFYWLAVDPKNAKPGADVIATHSGQVFNIEEAKDVDQLVIQLNDRLVDLDQPVVVTSWRSAAGKRSCPANRKNHFFLDPTARRSRTDLFGKPGCEITE